MSGDPPSSYGGWLPPSDREWSPPAPSDRTGPESPAPASWPGQAGPPGGRPQGENNGRATASLVLGILGLIVCPLILSVLAIVLGYQSRREIDASGGRQRNRGAATAGIVLGWVGLVFGIVIAVLIATGAGDFSFEVDDSAPAGDPAALLGLLLR